MVGQSRVGDPSETPAAPDLLWGPTAPATQIYIIYEHLLGAFLMFLALFGQLTLSPKGLANDLCITVTQ